ncbi:TPA: cyclic-guanylate-specific phosphodiesterase [Escherichia coli]
MIRQVIQRISNPEASIESLQERRFWLQCERAYTWQPIYQTCGRLMAVELLTVVTHPLNPSQRLPPDRYFTEITVSHRMEVVKEQIEDLPWLSFELVEHIRLPKDSTFASMCEFGPLWLDDFGTGMANFSALSEVRYDYIKIARELFVMLRQSPEGRTLFSQLLHLMNRYCRGVIVEGVETPEEWRDVQNSPAFAAQGWFLSRPAPIETLNTAVLAL